jgi:glycosyltransferase involved in cell wall biosynthesis
MASVAQPAFRGQQSITNVTVAERQSLAARDIAPSLSVVIPALNEEGGIAAIVERVLAVRSALFAVGIGALEVIVVDDGSQDTTPDIVAAYADLYPDIVRLIRHEHNRGYGAC